MRINSLRNAAILLALLVPANVLSTGVLSVQDTIAGLGVQAQLKGFAPKSSMDVVVVPPSGGTNVIPVTTDTAGNAKTLLPGDAVTEAGLYRAFTGQNGKRLTPDETFTVLADVVDAAHSTVEADDANLEADGRDSARVTVTLRDRYGNVLAGRPVELISSRNGDVILPLSRETNDNGTQSFSVSTNRPGTFSLQALDILSNTILLDRAELRAGGAVGGTLTASAMGSDYRYDSESEYEYVPTRTSPYAAQAGGASFGLIDHFEVVVEPRALKPSDAANVTIRAVDRNGETVEDYVGSVDIYSPTDPTATVPGFSEDSSRGRATFLAKNLGVKLLPLSVIFRKNGEQVLRVEDNANPNNIITGETTVTVSGSGPSDGRRITIISPPPDSTVNGTSVTIRGTTNPYTNVEITGGLQKVTGDTDEKGDFTIVVPIDTNHGEFTFHIEDDGGNEADLHLVRDTDLPVVLSAVFTPEKPQQGDRVLLTVVSEPMLKSATIVIGSQELPLREDPDKIGTYQLSFNAPVPGTYQPALTLRDEAGNETKSLLNITVMAKTLPVVQNLQAVAGASSVSLTWDPVTVEKVDRYRVYVGERPNDFGKTLETTGADTKAVVNNLVAGQTYFFAVTALKGDRESDGKSETVSARPIGLILEVTPQDQSLFMEWSIPEQMSIAQFDVEYGVEKGTFLEKRVVPGGDLEADEKRSVTLRDLLPGLTYFVRVTPVLPTGETVRELTAEGQGIPEGSGFNPSAGDPIPFDPLPTIPTDPEISPDDSLHGSAPGTPESGIPPLAWWLAGGIATLAILLRLHRRRTLRMTQDFLRTMDARYRS